jgi:hypothetical protein
MLSKMFGRVNLMAFFTIWAVVLRVNVAYPSLRIHPENCAQFGSISMARPLKAVPNTWDILTPESVLSTLLEKQWLA